MNAMSVLCSLKVVGVMRRSGCPVFGPEPTMLALTQSTCSLGKDCLIPACSCQEGLTLPFPHCCSPIPPNPVSLVAFSPPTTHSSSLFLSVVQTGF